MTCTKCGFQNPGDARFCGQCGNRFELPVGSTGSESDALSAQNGNGKLYLWLALILFVLLYLINN
jgi:uncharacterized membrane protein YvbJ